MVVPTYSGTVPHPLGENGGGRVGTSSQWLPSWLTHWICIAEVPVWSPASSVSSISLYSFGTHQLKKYKGVWSDFRIGASSPQFPLCYTAIGVATTLLSGTSRSDRGDVHENFAEKQTPHPFKPFRDYPRSPSCLKELCHKFSQIRKLQNARKIKRNIKITV